MKKRPYYFEIKNLITQFMGAFNDVAIKRYDRDRNTDNNYVGVGFVYAPKQRIIEDILSKSRQIPLPTISISIAGISRDPERVFNKIDGHYIHTATNSDTYRKIPQPVPVNLTINMSIIARYQSDAEQILSNFIPYCDPYITVSWKLPTTENTSYEKEIRTIIEWGGSINTQYPLELASNNLARVTYDTTFTIKGWLFKQIDEDVGPIYKVNTSFTPVGSLDNGCFIFNNTKNTIETYDLTDAFTLYGKPSVQNISRPFYYINYTDSSFVYTLYGKDFFKIKNLFLTSNTPNMFADYNFYDFFKDTKYSSVYPGFYGKEITTYTVNSLNSIDFTIPEPITEVGSFDVIVVNDAGYSVLSKDSLLPAHLPEYLDVAAVTPQYQPPCINGIQVIHI